MSKPGSRQHGHVAKLHSNDSGEPSQQSSYDDPRYWMPRGFSSSGSNSSEKLELPRGKRNPARREEKTSTRRRPTSFEHIEPNALLCGRATETLMAGTFSSLLPGKGCSSSSSFTISNPTNYAAMGIRHNDVVQRPDDVARFPHERVSKDTVASPNESSESEQEDGTEQDDRTIIGSHEVNGPLPSYGSATHPFGCRPCSLWFRDSCLREASCTYCHYAHPGQRRKRVRPSKRVRERMKALTEAGIISDNNPGIQWLLQ